LCRDAADGLSPGPACQVALGFVGENGADPTKFFDVGSLRQLPCNPHEIKIYAIKKLPFFIMSITRHSNGFTSFSLLDRIKFILKSNFKPLDKPRLILFMCKRERGDL
jgi:hypothetical protein